MNLSGRLLLVALLTVSFLAGDCDKTSIEPENNPDFDVTGPWYMTATRVGYDEHKWGLALSMGEDGKISALASVECGVQEAVASRLAKRPQSQAKWLVKT